MKKLKEILGSVRFLIVTLTAVMAIMTYYGVFPDEVRNIILAWAGTVVGIGTVDKLARVDR